MGPGQRSTTELAHLLLSCAEMWVLIKMGVDCKTCSNVPGLTWDPREATATKEEGFPEVGILRNYYLLGSWQY